MSKEMVTLALVNAKGGTAKTSTAHNVAHALAAGGKRVLLVDLDPQASLTLSCGIRPKEGGNDIASVLLEQIPIEKAIRSTNVAKVDIVPGSMAVSSFDITLSSQKDRHCRLRNALAKVEGYDVVVIDSPPALGLLPINALTAADWFVVPLVPEYLALEGLSTLMGAVTKVREGLGQCADLLGVVLTRVDRRTRATQELIQVIRKHYGPLVFTTEIPSNVRVSEAPSYGQSVIQYDATASGALAYKDLAKEILRYLAKQTSRKRGVSK